ncbi:GNAT family N-acetyltransferase [Pedobacter nutrimenti]|uniref:GNAT family N-acetyltransferase n=1 Tax=Pedobacter nutrimenti TaxID=1241337 RepID=UPI00292D1A3D|nr:GNAT family N-acetyltransferase [Pedobacter nutrimenti]
MKNKSMTRNDQLYLQDQHHLVLGDTVLVRPFDRAIDSIAELTALLHKAYKTWADQRIHFWAASQSNEVTLERIRWAKCFVAVKENRIIGTICFYSFTIKADSALYKRSDVGRFGQFAVDPEYQKLGLGAVLLGIVEQHAVMIGKKYLALDTSERATGLIRYYNRLGFEHVEFIQWEKVNYRSTVMSKALTDY